MADNDLLFDNHNDSDPGSFHGHSCFSIIGNQVSSSKLDRKKWLGVSDNGQNKGRDRIHHGNGFDKRVNGGNNSNFHIESALDSIINQQGIEYGRKTEEDKGLNKPAKNLWVMFCLRFLFYFL